MKPTTVVTVPLLLALTLGPAFAQTTQPAAPDPAAWVPADAVFYVGVTDLARTWAAIQATTAMRSMHDPRMCEFDPQLRLVGSVIDQVQKRVANLLGVPPAELQNPFGGPLAFYVVAQPGDTFADAQVGFIAGIDDAALMRQYFDAALSRLEEVAEHETQFVDADTVHVFRTKSTSQKAAVATEDVPTFEPFDEDEEAGSAAEVAVRDLLDELFTAGRLPSSLALCLTPDRFIMAGSAEQVCAALRREQGWGSLARTGDYQALLSDLEPVGPVRMLFNLPRLFELHLAVTSDDLPGRAALERSMRVAGIDCLRSLVGHVDVGNPDYDSKVELLLLTKNPRAGLVKVLCLENVPITPPSSVSRDACIYLNLNVNVPVFVDKLEQLFAATDPEAARALRGVLGDVVLLGPDPVNIRTDLLEHIVGPIILTLDIATPLTTGRAQPLLTLGHRDQRALTRFVTEHAPLFVARGGTTDPVFEAMFPPPLGRLALAPTTRQLHLGTVRAVDRVLAGTGDNPLVGTAAWQKAAQHVPARAWCTFYVDPHKLAAAALEYATHREELLMRGEHDLGLALLAQMSADIHPDQVERVQQLLQYAYPLLLTICTTPDGIRVTRVDLKGS